MMNQKIKSVFIAGLFGWLVAVFGAHAATKPPVEHFFENAHIASPQLSPSGKYLSVIIRQPSGRQVLGVVDTQNVAKVQVIAKSDTLDVFNPVWINDNRLYFSIGDSNDPTDKRNGEIYAINRDGTDQVKITTNIDESQGRKRFPLRGDYGLLGPVNDDSDDLIVGKYSVSAVDGAPKSVRLYKIDSKTLELTDLLGDLQPKEITGWVLDKDSQPRFAMGRTKEKTRIHYRDAGSKEWTQVAEFDILDSQAFTPLAIGGDGVVYVRKNNPAGFASLYVYDPKTRKVAAEPFFETIDFDIDANLVLERKTKRLLGLHYETDAPGSFWLDANMKTHQKKVDDKLTGTVNRLNCRNDVCLVAAFSDQDPGRYFLYQPKQDSWASLGAIRPQIVPQAQGTRDFYRFAARDGMKIPVYVTQPVGASAGRKPAVVLVHGGPTVRGGHWGWNNQAQFLASRGYVVIEPDFRGSAGYGDKHMRAGWRQWGLAMQDDLTDAANWAVAQGWVDKDRIAILGASYGGYATLMGLIKTPEIFRCGVNFVGVTDIDLLYSVTWSDASDAALQYGMPVMVGDPVKDAEQLRATSPLVQAHRLKSPLLMAYGVRDRRVPLVHGTKFRDAVMQHNPNVEWITYAEEGHGWRIEKNNYDFWTRVEQFLEKNLKPLP